MVNLVEVVGQLPPPAYRSRYPIEMQIALIGEYDPEFEPHVQTDAAIGHASDALDIPIDAHWVSTLSDELDDLSAFEAIWFAPGSPYRNLDRTIAALRHARETEIPTLGTCGGFQHMVIEYARNCLHIVDAQHAEYDPYASCLIVSRPSCSLVGLELNVQFTPGSMTAAAYGSLSASERYYCNFGINSDYIALFSENGFSTVGVDADGETHVMELAGHPFYIGTLFVPQSRSKPGAPHPLVAAFIKAADNNAIHRSREAGRFRMDNHSSRPGDC